MKELMQKIIELPELSLEEDEWSEVLDILDTLTIKSGDAFKIVIEEKILAAEKMIIQMDHREKLISYMYAWEEMTHLLLSWNIGIAEIWRDLFQEFLGNDDLLPILIDLLPNSKIELQAISNKLDQALFIEKSSEVGFVMTNLYSAAYYKLDNFNQTKSHTADKNCKKTLAVISEIKKQEHAIINLSSQFNHKQNQALNEVMTYIKLKYSANGSFDQQKALYFLKKNQLNDMTMDILQWDKEDHELMELIKKYFIFKDISLTLSRENISCVKKIEEFYAKIAQHKPWLRNEMKDKKTTFLDMMNAYLPHISLIHSLKPPYFFPDMNRFAKFFWPRKLTHEMTPKKDESLSESQNQEKI